MTRLFPPVVGVLLAGLLGPAWYALACPFCTSIAKTLSEDFAAHDVVVIARLERLPQPAPNANSSAKHAAPAATLTVVHVLKGDTAISPQKTFTAAMASGGQPGEKYLVMGIGSPELSWSTPVILNDREQQYLLDLVRLPPGKVERLAFFQQYLEDPDEMLLQDAYDEFARAPYATVKQLKPHLNHDQLLAWIRDPQVSASRKRLYYTLLGVCGNPADVPMLEQRLRDTGPSARSALDALIACYLTLRGPAGMSLIEEQFLSRRSANPDDPYADIYAAVTALRFHGTEENIVPRQRVLQALAVVLDNPRMADMVIPDLARWEDWSQLDRLVALFKAADPKASNVRLHIVNYARVCPLPAAKNALEEFNRIDPAVVKQSMTFFRMSPKDAK